MSSKNRSSEFFLNQINGLKSIMFNCQRDSLHVDNLWLRSVCKLYLFTKLFQTLNVGVIISYTLYKYMDE